MKCKLFADINECEQDPYPCHESALCYNTDGSFYCECQEGFTGDGLTACTGKFLLHSQSHFIKLDNLYAAIQITIYDDDSQHFIVMIIVLALSLLLTVIIISAIGLIVFMRSRRRQRQQRSTCKSSRPADNRQPTLKQSDILTAKANLRKVGTAVYPSATNPLAIQSERLKV